MYRNIQATITVEWECENCGASGITDVDGEELVDNSFTCLDFYCLECGEAIDHDR